MAVTPRRNRWIVTVYDKGTQKKRHVATCTSYEEGILVEAAALRGLPLPRRDPLEGYRTLNEPVVYFISAPDLGMVKIGFSTDLPSRFEALQGACPVELRILHAVPNGSPELEREFHARFQAHRVRGEWFRISGRIVDYLDEIAFPNQGLQLVRRPRYGWSHPDDESLATEEAS